MITIAKSLPADNYGLNAGYDDFTMEKLRDLSADSALYMQSFGTPDLPRQVTIKSELPTPRKGSLGTTKTYINVRHMVKINQGLENERSVPLVLKIETSVPIGTTVPELSTILHEGSIILTQTDNELYRRFVTGLLPE